MLISILFQLTSRFVTIAELHHHIHQKQFVRSRTTTKQAQSLLSAMLNFEDTTDDVENRFLANPEDLSFLLGLKIKLHNFIEQTHDEINRGRLIA